MDTRQRDALESLRRFQLRLDQYNDLLGKLNETRPRKELDGLIVRLDSSAAEHELLRIRKEGETIHKHELRKTLIEHHLAPIVSVKELNRPELVFMRTMELPPAGASDTALAIAAHSIADMASQRRDVFMRDGLDEDFVEQCLAAAQDLVRARTERDVSNLTWQRVTLVIESGLARSTVVTKAILTLARKALREHPPILAELRRALVHRPRPALPAPPRHSALSAGAPESASSSTALVPVASPLPVAAPPAPRRGISVLARVVEFFRPAS